MLAEMSRLKARIEEQIAAGEEPQIRVPPGSLVVIETKKGWRILTPKKWRTTKDKYRGWVMATPSGAPLRCRNTGCMRFLRKYMRDIVCSEECRSLLREWCYIHLDIIEGLKPAESLPMWCRTLSKPGLRIKEMLREQKKQSDREKQARYRKRQKEKQG
jgi:hypothetical protein